jgi:hypothetical protein
VVGILNRLGTSYIRRLFQIRLTFDPFQTIKIIKVSISSAFNKNRPVICCDFAARIIIDHLRSIIDTITAKDRIK